MAVLDYNEKIINRKGNIDFKNETSEITKLSETKDPSLDIFAKRVSDKKLKRIQVSEDTKETNATQS